MNPLLSLVFYFIYLQNFTNENMKNPHRLWYAFFLIILPIAAWIFYHVKKGKYTNLDVSNRHQRRTLYYFIYSVVVLFIFIQYYLNANWDFEAIYLLLLLILMGFSNYLIKSSMHTAFNLFVAALYFSHDIYLGIAWLSLTFLVAITRLILKRHTLAEVLMGALLGSIVSIAYLYTRIQIEHSL